MDVEQKVSLSVAAVAAASVAVSLLLPFISLPQTVTYQGPEVPYDGVNYTINGYFIPTVAQGELINVTFCCYLPHDVLLSLFPSRNSEISPSAPAILNLDPTTNATSFASVPAPSTQPYGIYVIAYNHTSYGLTISSTWSPFYVVRFYTVWLFLFMSGSGAAAYYYWQTAARRRDERRVRAELAERGSGRETG